MKENAKENELVKKLTNKHYTITTAESCTGGLLSATIINVSGASDVINCAYVTYANEAKENLVSVSHETTVNIRSIIVINNNIHPYFQTMFTYS